jgi:ADP-ribosylation factor related protein 1
MWTLVSGCYKQLMERREFGVLVVGLEAAGKTTLLERLKTMYGGAPGLPPDKIVTTVGCNVARLNLDRCKLLLWDLGGKVALRSIWEKYYADSKAVIYCIDASDPVHWEESKCVLMEVLKACPLVPLVVVCCKSDIPNSKHPESVAAFFALNTELEKRVKYVSASATTADDKKGIVDAMSWLERKLNEAAN